MIIFETANNAADLQGILALQKLNLKDNLTPEERKDQGFLTVAHSFDQLSRMNETEKHIIAKDKDKVIGYLLAMTEESKADIPVLIPMFTLFNETFLHEKPIAGYHYIVIGQACIDKAYRGQGVFDGCYDMYKKNHAHTYDFAITEIAASNTRSLTAHKRIGFKELKTYTSPEHTEWVIVAWDWS